MPYLGAWSYDAGMSPAMAPSGLTSYDPSRQAQLLSQEQLAAYATGERSAAEEAARAQMAQQRAAYQSAAATAQRGGYDPAMAQEASYAAQQSRRGVTSALPLAKQLEQQQAALAYSQGAGALMQSQLGEAALGRGYAQLALQDAYRTQQMRSGLDKLSYDEAAMGARAEEERKAQDRKAAFGTVGAVTGLGAVAGKMW
jgi:hypothetical protein